MRSPVGPDWLINGPDDRAALVCKAQVLTEFSGRPRHFGAQIMRQLIPRMPQLKTLQVIGPSALARPGWPDFHPHAKLDTVHYEGGGTPPVLRHRWLRVLRGFALTQDIASTLTSLESFSGTAVGPLRLPPSVQHLDLGATDSSLVSGQGVLVLYCGSFDNVRASFPSLQRLFKVVASPETLGRYVAPVAPVAW